eukprot:gene3138-2120_t
MCTYVYVSRDYSWWFIAELVICGCGYVYTTRVFLSGVLCLDTLVSARVRFNFVGFVYRFWDATVVIVYFLRFTCKPFALMIGSVCGGYLATNCVVSNFVLEHQNFIWPRNGVVHLFNSGIVTLCTCVNSCGWLGLLLLFFVFYKCVQVLVALCGYSIVLLVVSRGGCDYSGLSDWNCLSWACISIGLVRAMSEGFFSWRPLGPMVGKLCLFGGFDIAVVLWVWCMWVLLLFRYEFVYLWDILSTLLFSIPGYCVKLVVLILLYRFNVIVRLCDGILIDWWQGTYSSALT